MAEKEHPCFVPACGQLIPSSRLMCYVHWRMVPRALQTEVYRGWNNGRPTAFYLDAIERARASIVGAA